MVSLYLLSRQRVNTGQYRLVRFMAPVAGTYKVTAKFEGVHFGLSTTDVHVLHNGASLFDADIDGCGGDPVFPTIPRIEPDRGIFRPGRTERATTPSPLQWGTEKQGALWGHDRPLRPCHLALPIWQEVAKHSHQESLKDGI